MVWSRRYCSRFGCLWILLPNFDTKVTWVHVGSQFEAARVSWQWLKNELWDRWKGKCLVWFIGVARRIGNGTRQWDHKYAMLEKWWGHENMGMHTSCNCTYMSCHYYATFAWCYLPVGFSLVPDPCITCIVC